MADPSDLLHLDLTALSGSQAPACRLYLVPAEEHYDAVAVPAVVAWASASVPTPAYNGCWLLLGELPSGVAARYVSTVARRAEPALLALAESYQGTTFDGTVQAGSWDLPDWQAGRAIWEQAVVDAAAAGVVPVCYDAAEDFVAEHIDAILEVAPSAGSLGNLTRIVKQGAQTHEGLRLRYNELLGVLLEAIRTEIAVASYSEDAVPYVAALRHLLKGKRHVRAGEAA